MLHWLWRPIKLIYNREVCHKGRTVCNIASIKHFLNFLRRKSLLFAKMYKAGYGCGLSLDIILNPPDLIGGVLCFCIDGHPCKEHPVAIINSLKYDATTEKDTELLHPQWMLSFPVCQGSGGQLSTTSSLFTPHTVIVQVCGYIFFFLYCIYFCKLRCQIHFKA